MIIMREVIAVDDRHFPKGLIMSWPNDMDPPPGMVWFREEVIASLPSGDPITMYGEPTEEAMRIMQEVADGRADTTED